MIIQKLTKYSESMRDGFDDNEKETLLNCLDRHIDSLWLMDYIVHYNGEANISELYFTINSDDQTLVKLTLPHEYKIVESIPK